MYLSKNIIFLPHPRAGSRSIAKGLEAIGFKMVGAHHDGPNPAIFDMDTIEDYLLFTNVRNHWDTLTSWFYNAVGQADFPKFTVEWVRNWYKQNPTYFRLPRLFWFLGEFPQARILRYETLAEQFHEMFGPLLSEATSLPFVGKGEWRPAGHYREVMPNDVRDFIGETFADEIEELGYKF